MAQASLNSDSKEMVTGKDSIVIVDNRQSIRGGRTLDTTGYPKLNINAGHVIIQNDTTKDYLPMPLDGTGLAYAALPAGHSYAGIQIQSVPTAKPFVGILVNGCVNFKATPFPMTPILAAVRAALPRIDFRSDLG